MATPNSPKTIRQMRDLLRDTTKERFKKEQAASGSVGRGDPATTPSRIPIGIPPAASPAPARITPQVPTPGPGQRFRKLSRGLSLGVALNAAQSADRREQNQQPQLTDAYAEAMGQVGGIDRGNMRPTERSYTEQKDGETKKEMGRQRAMTERAEQFLGVESTAMGEGNEESPQGETRQQMARGEGQAAPREGGQANAQEELRFRQLADQQQQERERAEAEALKKMSFLQRRKYLKQKEQVDKAKQKMIRRSMRQLLSTLIPVIGFVVALNVEFIHDRYKPIIPTLRQKPEAIRGMATIVADGCLCCCCCLQAAFPLIVIAAVIISLIPHF